MKTGSATVSCCIKWRSRLKPYLVLCAHAICAVLWGVVRRKMYRTRHFHVLVWMICSQRTTMAKPSQSTTGKPPYIDILHAWVHSNAWNEPELNSPFPPLSNVFPLYTRKRTRFHCHSMAVRELKKYRARSISRIIWRLTLIWSHNIPIH